VHHFQSVYPIGAEPRKGGGGRKSLDEESRGPSGLRGTLIAKKKKSSICLGRGVRRNGYAQFRLSVPEEHTRARAPGIRPVRLSDGEKEKESTSPIRLMGKKADFLITLEKGEKKFVWPKTEGDLPPQ